MPTSSTKDATMVAIKKANGIKVKLNRKPVKRKPGVPSPGLPVPSSARLEEQNVEEFEEQDEAGIPCDTLFAIQSIIQAQQCLFIPLQSGGPMIPSVLESQLYQRLENPTDGDSIVTKELLELIQASRLRRLASLDSTLVTFMRTRDYIRAVWDAHRTLGDDSKALLDVTTWFVSSLSKWTRQSISKHDMSLRWTSRTATFEQVLDILATKLRVVIVTGNLLQFWLPTWGTVLQAVDKAQTNIILRIKRSVYKELSEQSIRNLSLPGGLSAYFVTQTLVAMGKVQVHKKAAGAFVRLTTS
jgi:hypothetical protein